MAAINQQEGIIHHKMALFIAFTMKVIQIEW